MANDMQLEIPAGDFTYGTFTEAFETEGMIYYASFHPEINYEDGKYVTTGRYLVTGVFPRMGLTSFVLDLEDDSWVLDDRNYTLDENLLDWCNVVIDSRNQ